MGRHTRRIGHLPDRVFSRGAGPMLLALMTVTAACGDSQGEPTVISFPEAIEVEVGAEPFLHRTVDRQAPPFTLIDPDSRPVSLADFAGKWVLVDWVFTNCVTFCPLLTGDMTSVHQQLGDAIGERVELVTISFDPTRDSPAAMRAYAAQVGGLKPGWTWLTGSQQETDDVAASYGVSFEAGGSVSGVDQFDHTALMVVIGPNGRERHRYFGTGWSDDVIDRLEAEMSGGAIPATPAPEAAEATPAVVSDLLADAIALPWEDFEVEPGVETQVLYQFPNVGQRGRYVDHLLDVAAESGAVVRRGTLSAMATVLITESDGGVTALGYTQNLLIFVESGTESSALDALYRVDNEWCCGLPG